MVNNLVNKLNLDKFAHQVHEASVARGNWPDDRTASDVLCLVHSKWSDAFAARDNPETAAGFLIDGLILLLDAAVAWGIPVPSDLTPVFEETPCDVRELYGSLPLSNFIMVLHRETAWLFDGDITQKPEVHRYELEDIIVEVYLCLGARGIDADTALQARVRQGSEPGESQ